ncbi:MAG: ATP-binding protein, partial [Pseudomonadota bacterium]
LKQTEPANAMLTRLSGFLRHTLITEPGSQVTLEQEVETLQLYLGIERMRFEERLRTHFEIEDDALEAKLPSMLLQPLIENAIKYAVSPQEEGARISLSARIVGQRLRISVEDTGPGADGPLQLGLLDYASDNSDQPVSTGVGLANIRNRLMQAYGEDHVFETKSEPGGGFTVLIEIPYQRASESASEPESGRVTAGSPAPAVTDDAKPASEESTAADASASVIPLNPARTMGSSA